MRLAIALAMAVVLTPSASAELNETDRDFIATALTEHAAMMETRFDALAQAQEEAAAEVARVHERLDALEAETADIKQRIALVEHEIADQTNATHGMESQTSSMHAVVADLGADLEQLQARVQALRMPDLKPTEEKLDAVDSKTGSNAAAISDVYGALTMAQITLLLLFLFYVLDGKRRLPAWWRSRRKTIQSEPQQATDAEAAEYRARAASLHIEEGLESLADVEPETPQDPREWSLDDLDEADQAIIFADMQRRQTT